MIKRTYTKTVLIETLKDEIQESIPGIVQSILATDSFVTITLVREPTTQEDADLQAIVMANLPSDSFVDEQILTNTRNVEGFELYKKIFAHISDNDAVTNIDGFIAISDNIHKLRNFLKDGNFETALRYFYKEVRPLNAFIHQELYRTWITEFVLKWRPELGFVNPAFEGSPYEGWTGIKYIEEAIDA